MAVALTSGSIVRPMLLFALPLTLGNLLQQLYNITDTAIVGQFVGPDALAAVGSAYSLMTFITSIITGLCLGSTSLLSLYYGKGDSRAHCLCVFHHNRCHYSSAACTVRCFQFQHSQSPQHPCRD